MRTNLFLLLTISLSLLSCGRGTDVCIYGGSSACVTDIGNKQAVIGLARQFYRKLGTHYGKLEQWLFEPHVAEEILMNYLDTPGIKLMQGWYLDSVEKDGNRIKSITCTDRKGKNTTIKAKQFIDCSYEGDLMASAGVSYRVGPWHTHPDQRNWGADPLYF